MARRRYEVKKDWKYVSKIPQRGSSYARYKKMRNPSSGVEFVHRSKPQTHFYGRDIGRRTIVVGEGNPQSVPFRKEILKRMR